MSAKVEMTINEEADGIQLVCKTYETKDATKCEKDIALLLTQAILAFEVGLKAHMDAKKKEER